MMNLPSPTPIRKKAHFKINPLFLCWMGAIGITQSTFAHATDWTTAELLSQKPTSVPYQDIADYLSRSSNGWITGSPLAGSTFPSNLSFRVNIGEQSLVTNTIQSPDLLDLQFNFDESAFIRSMHQPDFLRAKIAYYQTLPFSQLSQRYARNYLYPEDWMDLFFPPVHTLTLPNQQYDERFIDRSALPQNSTYYSADWHKSVDALTNTRLTFGNELEILTNGLSHDKKKELILKAQNSIYIGVMTFTCDANSMELLDALADRVRAGVDVRIMMEGLWTELAYQGCMKKMKDAGIEVILATDMLKAGNQQGLFHNKIWIFDNHEAIMGGENIITADGASTGFNHNNRDVDVHVFQGPAVTEMMQAYINLYDRYIHTPLQKKQFRGVDALRSAYAQRFNAETLAGQRGQDHYAQILGSPSTRSKGVCRFAIQGPEGDGNRHRVSQVYTEYIKQAQQSLYMTSPKVDFQEGNVKNPTGNTQIWNAVQERAQNGVQVDAITDVIDGESGSLGNDFRNYADQLQAAGHLIDADLLRDLASVIGISDAAADRHYLQVLGRNPNIRPWNFFQFYHGKTIDFDRTALAIGSFNLESFSAEHSHESTLICQDEGLLEAQDSLILRDLVNSVPVFQY